MVMAEQISELLLYNKDIQFKFRSHNFWKVLF